MTLECETWAYFMAWEHENINLFHSSGYGMDGKSQENKFNIDILYLL